MNVSEPLHSDVENFCTVAGVMFIPDRNNQCVCVSNVTQTLTGDVSGSS